MKWISKEERAERDQRRGYWDAVYELAASSSGSESYRRGYANGEHDALFGIDKQ
jgi:hypothetical protein